jgi:tetraprenyl-beta-curcumene synthase
MGSALTWSREYFGYVRPAVREALNTWHVHAAAIPHPVLRAQALSSLTSKHFHCEGGAIYAVPSRDPEGHLFRFIIPYQTLCDYLDTVTDRGPSQDPENLRLLHQSLWAAVNPGCPTQDFYALHPHQDDGGYIARLIDATQHALVTLPGFEAVKPWIEQLVARYIDLQVLKHGPPTHRVSLLSHWAQAHHASSYHLSWWEFSAAAGSTLGIFALLNQAQEAHPHPDRVEAIFRLYFPWMGALHILLDYFVDQEEDRVGGDLNFVSYYDTTKDAIARMAWLCQRTQRNLAALDDAGFHRFVAQGLVGFYLSDRKIGRPPPRPARQLLYHSGLRSIGIYLAALLGRSP